MAAPALLIASIAYSTWYNLPSGEKIVVLLSYRRDISSPSSSSSPVSLYKKPHPPTSIQMRKTTQKDPKVHEMSNSKARPSRRDQKRNNGCVG
jgi:hypothetical protein